MSIDDFKVSVFRLRAFFFGGGGPWVGEVPHLGEVTLISSHNLSIFLDRISLHVRWGTPPRRAKRLARPGKLLSWGEFSPCESL